MNLFLITEVKKNKEKGLYSLVLIASDFESRTQIDSVFDEEIKALKRHFKADSLRMLSKTSFESEYDDPIDAFNLFLLNLDGNKEMSMEEYIFRKCAEALARFEKPDLSFASDKVLLSTFLKVFRGCRANPIWLAKFKTEVENLSCHRVHLNIIQGQDAINGEHFELVRGQEIKNAVICPDATSPIQFIEI